MQEIAAQINVPWPMKSLELLLCITREMGGTLSKTQANVQDFLQRVKLRKINVTAKTTVTPWKSQDIPYISALEVYLFLESESNFPSRHEYAKQIQYAKQLLHVCAFCMDNFCRH